MITFDINWWAALVSLAFYIILGFLWYGNALFGKRWAALIGKTEEELKAKSSSAFAPMPILAAVGVFILAQVVLWTGATTVVDGIMIGFWMWLGFYFAPVLMNHLFAQRNLTLFWIESLYNLVAWMTAGALLAAWQM